MYRKCVSRLRLVSHSLLIEVGRHLNIPKNNRICQFCTRNEIDDEHHYVLRCPRFHDLRKELLPKMYIENPTALSFCKLMKSKDVKILYNLGKYLYLASKIRNV